MSTTGLTPASPDKSFDAFGFVARFAPLVFPAGPDGDLSYALSRVPLVDQSLRRHASGVDHPGLGDGMTFVILTAGIDLSVGSLLAFAGLVAARADVRTVSRWAECGG